MATNLWTLYGIRPSLFFENCGLRSLILLYPFASLHVLSSTPSHFLKTRPSRVIEYIHFSASVSLENFGRTPYFRLIPFLDTLIFSFFKHPQLLLLPAPSARPDTSLIAPQSQRHSQNRLRPYFVVTVRERDKTSSLPYRDPVLSINFAI